MVENTINLYLEDLIRERKLKIKKINVYTIKSILKNDPNLKSFIVKKLKNIKILDSSCGSGRFPLILAKFLFNILKSITPSYNIFKLKKSIIENNIFGIDIEKESCIISKLRLYKWLFLEERNHNNSIRKISNMDEICELLSFENSNIRFNIEHVEFLLKYQTNIKFDIIIGNPPYIENKKIKDINYKKKLYKSFKTAYKLFDLSILFIEKSLRILKDNSGLISFIITNKFLSSDYGIKLREILIKNTEIKNISNISSLPIFSNKSTYPIIIYIKNKIPTEDHEILLQKYESIESFINRDQKDIDKFNQKKLYSLPGKVISLKGDINFLYDVFSHYKSMEDKYKDLKIIYRPYGFTNYAKYYQNVNKKTHTDKDLLLIGTGNVGKYHIKFNKKITIAKNNLNVSYFNLKDKNPTLIDQIGTHKIIFREIAKELTCVYDPGVFTNITGLYFIKIPSLQLYDLFAILSILNSKFMDNIFKVLFGTLHMSGGYLRFNGSFIKRLPMPDYLPLSLAKLGKIMLFLCQLYYDYTDNTNFNSIIKDIEIKNYIQYFNSLSESLTKLLYLSGLNNNFKTSFQELNQLLYQNHAIPDIEFKYTYPYFNLSKFEITSKQENSLNISKINKCFKNINSNKNLTTEIKKITSK